MLETLQTKANMKREGQGFEGSNGFFKINHVLVDHVIGQMESEGIVNVDGFIYYLDDKSFFTDEPLHLFVRNRVFQTDSAYKEYMEEFNRN